MIRLAVRVARADAELVLAELLGLVPSGLEERDVDAETVEYALYGAAGELPALPELRATVGGALVDVETTELPDDWDERWRDFHRPVDVTAADGRRLRVRPPWEPALPGALDVVIDPGQAFGTGQHPTTRLCLELLAQLEAAGPLADWGCGSGVLALAAARLGWGPILACDVEEASVEATVDGARANGLPAERLEDLPDADTLPIATGPEPPGGRPTVLAARGDLRRAPGPWAPTVVANLVRPLLLEVAAGLERVPDRLVASGLELDEADEVVAAFARHGLTELARREGDGWAAVLLERRRG